MGSSEPQARPRLCLWYNALLSFSVNPAHSVTVLQKYLPARTRNVLEESMTVPGNLKLEVFQTVDMFGILQQ